MNDIAVKIICAAAMLSAPIFIFAENVPAPAAHVERIDLGNELTVQGEFRPYTEVELHSKAAGFLKQINVDVGDQVKAGQSLATLEVPELKDELEHAKAAVLRMEADFKNARLAHTRLTAVNKDQPNLVAQQDLDTAEAKENSAAAALSEAKADKEKYQTLLDYTEVTAPFDGVITRRYADPGALVQTGGNSSPLVRISNNYKLRLDFPVSVSFVKSIAVGDPVEVQLDGVQKSFSAKITRFTRKVETDTRTMEAEVEVANTNLDLIPGMYATVKLQVDRRAKTLAVPVEAVAGGKAPTVFVINKQSEIEERPVTVGIETPTKVEILSGLEQNEVVVVGSRSQFTTGEKVEPKFAAGIVVQ